MEERHFCIGSINVNNLEPYKDSRQDDRLFSDIKSHDLDLLLLHRMEVNWLLIPREHQWMERAKEHFEPGSF